MSDFGRLGSIWDQLSKEDRHSVLAFAEFLLSKPAHCVHEQNQKIIPIHRPDEESVAAALQRLKDSYVGADTSKVLAEAAELMMQHVMLGRPANQVIDELEQLFKTHFLDGTE